MVSTSTSSHVLRFRLRALDGESRYLRLCSAMVESSLTVIAKFTVQVRGYTQDDADMLCLNLFVDFVSHSSWTGFARQVNETLNGRWVGAVM